MHWLLIGDGSGKALTGVSDGQGGAGPHSAAVWQIWVDIQISSYVSVDVGTTGIGQYFFILLVVAVTR